MVAKPARMGKSFLAIVCVEALVLVVFQVVSLLTTDDRDERLYGVLLLFSVCFFVFFAFDGVLNENFLQITTFLFFSALLTVYVVYQLAVVEKDSVLNLLQVVVVILGDLAYCYFGYQLYLEFGWRIYKKIGADPQMRSMYKAFQVFMTFLKVDYQFQIVLLAQNLTLVLATDDVEFYLNIVGVLIVTAVVALGVYAVRKENSVLMIIFIVLAVLEPAYVIFRCYRLVTDDQYSDLPIKQMFITAGASIFCRVLLVAVAIVVMVNFGKGLKEHVLGDGDGGSNEEKADRSDFGSYPNRRMTVV